MSRRKPRVVYLAIPYSEDPAWSEKVAAKAQREILLDASRCSVVLAPQLCLSRSFDERTERAQAMMACFAMVRISDEVWAWRSPKTGEFSPGVTQELLLAEELGIPVTVKMPEAV
jgi:hypothetical protein